MARLDVVTLEIKTGERCGPEKLMYNINGFPMEFDETEGGTGPGETCRAVGNPRSFPHSLTLAGPETGHWDVESVTAIYECMGEDPYTIRMGAVTLDDESDLNIWHERPVQTFDV